MGRTQHEHYHSKIPQLQQIMNRPRLFISYSHYPAAHKKRVEQMIADLEASNLLEVHGDFMVKDPQGPPKGWTAWMREEIEAADWILVVCNTTYRNAWEKQIPIGNRGSTYETAMLMHELYTEGMINRRLIPVTLGEGVRISSQGAQRFHGLYHT